MFGKLRPADKARNELAELDREEFLLRKNMLHDRYRLAYIRSRRRQLKADHPVPAPLPAQPSMVVRWIGRVAGSDVPQLE